MSEEGNKTNQNQTQTQTQTNVITGTIDGELVPGVTNEMVAYKDVDSEEKARIDALINEINMADANSVIFFGSKAQEKVTEISDKMLEGVKNKDLGRSGEALNEMVATIRGFDVDELDPNKKPGFFARLFGKAKPLVKFLQRYEEVRKQIDSITNKLESHKTALLKDITSLDRLYVANLEYFHTLEDYIKAGDEKINQLHHETIPALEKEAEGSDDMLMAQKLRDLRSSTADLERRVHDLRLTRQVTLQSLPSIRLVQENDKGLINKINSTIANTVPLWRQQLAQTVTIWRSEQAADTIKDATDLTNEMLAANADNLKIANRKIREQMERGVFDIEVVKLANQKLIETIDDSLRIAEEGKAKRKEAVVELEKTEEQLRDALLSNKAKYNEINKNTD